VNDSSKLPGDLTTQEKRALLEQLLREKAAKPKSFPVSFAQQRLWILNQLLPDSPVYNVSTAVLLSGPLDIGALERTFTEIIRRHQSLRTTFTTVDADPAQIVHPAQPVTLSVQDLSDLPDKAREAKTRRLVYQEARLPFDLSKDPLLRHSLLRLGDEQHVLLLTMHHIVSDGWSMGVLQREVTALYDAFANGEASPLPELEIQYADYTVWQREWMQGQVLDELLAYWKQQLLGAPSVLELPTDNPRPRIPSYNGAAEPFILSRALTERLKQVCQHEEVTLFMTLLAAFQVLLMRYSGETEIVVGTPVANRTRGETEGLIGFFVNTLALRVSLEGDLTWRELLRRVKEVAVGAFAHQELPFEKLVEELQPVRDISHQPLFQVMLVLQNASSQEPVRLRGLELYGLGVETRTAKFDLTLSLEESSDELYGNIEYNTDLFAAETIRRLAEHYERLVDSLVSDREQPLRQVQLLSASERQQILYDWNQTRTYEQEVCIHELFEKQVRLRPESVAVVYEDEALSYQELEGRANQVAHYLQQRGVGPETIVGVCLERSLEMVVGLLGVLKAGGAYVPLDPAYPASRLSFMMADAQVGVVLTQAELRSRLPAHEGAVVCLDSEWSQIAEQSAERPRRRVRTENAAYVIYTSGSTGQPKGVLVTHANVARLMAATEEWFNFDERDVWTMFHSYAFDFSVWELWGALGYGGRLVIIPQLLSRTPEGFYQLLVKEQVTVLNQTPSAFRQLVVAEESMGSAEQLQLRVVIFGGEALETSSLQPWMERHGEEQPRLVNMYGITETTVHVTYHPVEMAEVAAGGWSRIGRAIGDLKVYVLDGEMEPVTVGVNGEMYVGGAGVARNYVNRAELTAERFVPDPYGRKAGRRLYRTGDVGRYRADGELEYIGRRDEQVKVRGYRIELGEIEAVLRGHEGVSEATVVVREDVVGDKRLVAYVTVERDAAGAAINEVTLWDYLKERLPEYMVPGAFVQLAEMPLTPNGKVDRRALPEYSRMSDEIARAFVAPRNLTEETIANIFAQVLGVEKVGIHDNFFMLGGHSLLATRVISKIRQAFQMEAPLRLIFEAPTVAGLAVGIVQVQSEHIDSEDISRMLAEINELSEDEAHALTLTGTDEADASDGA
jgi:amino acid adenylation domain-containing protein